MASASSEAMIALLHEQPDDQRRIRHVDFLQAPPKFHRPGFMFMHFYGNHISRTAFL